MPAFDHKETPVAKAIGVLESAAGDLDDALGGTKDILDFLNVILIGREEDYDYENDIERYIGFVNGLVISWRGY